MKQVNVAHLDATFASFANVTKLTIAAAATFWCGSAAAAERTLDSGARIAPEAILAGEYGYFAGDVALDGDRLLVGAKWHSNFRNGRGAAYLYDFNGGQWTLSAALHSADSQPSGAFGSVVAIDGSTIFVGDVDYPVEPTATGMATAGAVFVFEKSASGWTQVDKLVAVAPTSYEHFGRTIALQGNIAFIAESPGMGVYQRIDGVWKKQTILLPTQLSGLAMPGFGNALAISASDALVSSSGQDGRTPPRIDGVVHAYARDAAGQWLPAGTLEPADPVWGGGFDQSLDMSGTTAIIGGMAFGPHAGGPRSGAAYIFEKIAGEWVETAKLQASDKFPDDQFGFQVAIDGNLAAVSAAEGNGRIYVFQRDDGGAWQEVAKIRSDVPFSEQQFGVALDLVGQRLAVGSRLDLQFGWRAGAAYVFQVPEPATTHIAAMLAGLFAIGRSRAHARRSFLATE